jgi:hypothetical protein
VLPWWSEIARTILAVTSSAASGRSLPIPSFPARFVVGLDAGLTSNAWRVWTGPDGSIYLACRDNYQELKASLHPTLWRPDP